MGDEAFGLAAELESKLRDLLAELEPVLTHDQRVELYSCIDRASEIQSATGGTS